MGVETADLSPSSHRENTRETLRNDSELPREAPLSSGGTPGKPFDLCGERTSEPTAAAMWRSSGPRSTTSRRPAEVAGVEAHGIARHRLAATPGDRVGRGPGVAGHGPEDRGTHLDREIGGATGVELPTEGGPGGVPALRRSRPGAGPASGDRHLRYHRAVDNSEIATLLGEMADLLEIDGANPFRVRAYRNAARTLEAETEPVSRKLERGEDLTELAGVGKELAAHVAELVATGRLGVYEELAGRIPEGLLDLMRLPNVGPKRARKLWDELGVTSVAELETAARKGRIAGLSGFGERSQEKILQGIAEYHEHQARARLSDADGLLRPLLDHLRGTRGLDRLEVAGSYRRRRETVGDLDLLAISSRPEALMQRFLGYRGIAQVDMAGPTRASVHLSSGLQVDLRVVPPESYGAALVYFTGSKEHNIKLRKRAVERGLKISEYGVFRADSDGILAGTAEQDVYAAVDLPWIPPELREDRGEIEAAEKGRLPRLLELGDLRGDLQMHSTWSDGRASIEEMLEACAARGYEYFALTDHSKALAMTGGLDAARLRDQWAEIEEIAARHPEIRLLKSMEIDILGDGSLDLEDEMIDGLDLVLVSVHSRFDLPEKEQTARVLRALDHPRVHVLAHPTGRLINRRKPIALDLDRVLEAAAARGVAVELNAHPERLDLKDTHLMRARELGVPVVVSTDAHSPADLGLMRYGVEQARRAWLGPGDVLNTKPLSELLAILGRKRPAKAR